MDDFILTAEDLSFGPDYLEGKLAKNILIDFFSQFNWHPESKEFGEQYAVVVKVPVKHAVVDVDCDDTYPIMIVGSYKSPYCYKIHSLLPVPVHTKDFVDSAIPLVEKIAIKAFGDEKNYTLSPDYTNENMGINVDYLLALQPMDIPGGKSFSIDDFFGTEDILKIVQKQVFISYYYVEFFKWSADQESKDTKNSSSDYSSSKEFASAQPSHKNDTDTATLPTKSKILAGFLALLLGGLGAHKFYLGKTGIGFLYLIFCWSGIPAFISLFEALTIWSTSDKDFEREYNCRIG